MTGASGKFAFLERVRAFRWTWLRIVVATLTVWGILLLAFHEGRMCYPTRAICREQFFAQIGDAVWLRYWHEWQTLIAGLLAIATAFIGGYYINAQMKQAEAHERERRRRALASARAMLVFGLDTLTDYLEECAKALRNARRACVGTTLPRTAPRPSFPAIPADVISSLQTMVEASDADQSAHFSTILNKLQVFDARITDMARRGGEDVNREKIVTAENIESFVLNAAEIHAMASMLFSYARDETNDLPSAKMIATQHSTSLHVLGFREHEFPTLFETMRRRVNRMLGIEPEAN